MEDKKVRGLAEVKQDAEWLFNQRQREQKERAEYEASKSAAQTPSQASKDGK
jgi:hypothetical protein